MKPKSFALKRKKKKRERESHRIFLALVIHNKLVDLVLKCSVLSQYFFDIALQFTSL